MSNHQSVQRRALKRFAFSLLPIAAAVLAQPAAHAADPGNWVATRTQAFLLPAGASAGTATASIASTTQRVPPPPATRSTAPASRPCPTRRSRRWN
ncbi:hypothetical protein [Burkholderia gladioli]|uniref:hypothetical protein n=1 Tax=Burkholderia gladioli TaxID=28095 RepID=UPI003C7B7FEB